MNGFKEILTKNILPFWMDHMLDMQHGGFYGRIDGHNKLHPGANKGVVLNTRILWTFSAAYRTLGNPKYKTMAERAYEYIKAYFIDKIHGGVFWELDCKGSPINRKKQLYAQGFALYGFSEFYRATGYAEALDLCKEFFYLIEGTADTEHGGYLEAFAEDWKPLADMRLSAKDANEKKSMNTHLHILEPYTNLYRIWKHPTLENAQKKLIDIFSNRILDKKSGHLHLFFDEKWAIKSRSISYGHDIEASWLLLEAADVLADAALVKDIRELSLKIAVAASEGLQRDGSLAYELEGDDMDLDRHWWVQAEAVVGFLCAFRNSGDVAFSKKATKVWSYIRSQLIDIKNGEWYWSRKADGSINLQEDKAGPWKCPYHNARMCMEALSLLG
ncbi:AGE family epimerase/isomerase [Olivibacter sitiensis]|uniref:AGE family epimerase/isomerase n=1 Tax=Olivibacter sitiensis TaxID=376470 RepID=UPI00041EB004|nr:AGE family epimerase/isomerase [Olivibacter sitiensis]